MVMAPLSYLSWFFYRCTAWMVFYAVFRAALRKLRDPDVRHGIDLIFTKYASELRRGSQF